MEQLLALQALRELPRLLHCSGARCSGRLLPQENKVFGHSRYNHPCIYPSIDLILWLTLSGVYVDVCKIVDQGSLKRFHGSVILNEIIANVLFVYYYVVHIILRRGPWPSSYWHKRLRTLGVYIHSDTIVCFSCSPQRWDNRTSALLIYHTPTPVISQYSNNQVWSEMKVPSIGSCLRLSRERTLYLFSFLGLNLWS